MLNTKKLFRYLLGLGLAAVASGCNTDMEFTDNDVNVKTVAFRVSTEMAVRSRANSDESLTVCSGELATELTYVIRDDKGNVVVASGFPGAPSPVRSDEGWSLEVSLDASVPYEIFFAATDEVMPVGYDKYDSSKNNVSRYVRLLDNTGIELWTGNGELAFGHSETFTFYARSFSVGDENTITLRRPTCEIIVAVKGADPKTRLITNSIGWIFWRPYCDVPRSFRFGNYDTDYSNYEDLCCGNDIIRSWDNFTLKGIIDNYNDYSIINCLHLPRYDPKRIFGRWLEMDLYWEDGCELYPSIDLGDELDSLGCIAQPNYRILILIDLTTSFSFEVLVDRGFNSWDHEFTAPYK